MPFDQHKDGGGGDDPGHQRIPEIVRATLEALGRTVKTRGICLECTALQMAGSSMAIFLMQQDAADMDTHEVNVDLVQRLIQAITDVAMREIKLVLDEHQARKG